MEDAERRMRELLVSLLLRLDEDIQKFNRCDVTNAIAEWVGLRWGETPHGQCGGGIAGSPRLCEWACAT